jgi:hypothetical protein
VNDTVVARLGGTPTRYHSGGWTVSAAAVGAAPEGVTPTTALSLATTTREGYLRLYPTATPIDGSHNCAALKQWPQYQHDAFNSGNYGTDAERPYPPRQLSGSNGPGGLSFSFITGGDDRDCGTAQYYEVRVGGTSWATAKPWGNLPASQPGGSRVSVGFAGPGQPGVYWLRIFDRAGNGSAAASVTLK